MPKRYDILKEDLLIAMKRTKSVRATARYLNCSYNHCKKWMKFYTDSETGQTLFELHKNPFSIGIPKHLSATGESRKKEPPILDLVEGRIDSSSFTPAKIKYRLIESGFMEERCYHCGFCERRVLDYKIPLILNFKDKNKEHYRLKNLELLCYNCYFLYVAEVFTEQDVKAIEDHVPVLTKEPTWEIDEYTQKRIKELGLMDKDDDDPYSLVSRNNNVKKI